TRKPAGARSGIDRSPHRERNGKSRSPHSARCASRPPRPYACRPRRCGGRAILPLDAGVGRRARVVVSTIEELSDALLDLGTRFGEHDSRLGYFSALYAVMTAKVADGLATNRFQDGERMQRLACHFAGRYLSALERFEGGGRAPESWRVAFEAAKRWRPLI